MKLKCLQCNKEFKGYQGNPNKYCSRQCMAIFQWSKPEYRKHMSDVHKGQVSGSKGKHWKLSEESKQKMKGRVSNMGMLGKKHSKETREKLSLAHTGTKKPWASLRGELNHNYIKDRSLIKRQEERNSPLDKQWKYNVYKRDNFKCKMLNSDCKGRIEAHHILSWKNYPELRFIINNGITLCHFHHPKKRADEINLSPYFKTLVMNVN